MAYPKINERKSARYYRLADLRKAVPVVPAEALVEVRAELVELAAAVVVTVARAEAKAESVERAAVVVMVAKVADLAEAKAVLVELAVVRVDVEAKVADLAGAQVVLAAPVAPVDLIPKPCKSAKLKSSKK